MACPSGEDAYPALTSQSVADGLLTKFETSPCRRNAASLAPLPALVWGGSGSAARPHKEPQILLKNFRSLSQKNAGPHKVTPLKTTAALRKTQKR